MSVKQAQSDFDFAVQFYEHVETLINTVRQWESVVELDNSPAEFQSDLVEYRTKYQAELVEVTLRLVRFRELCKEYGILASEEWLKYVPLSKVGIRPPNGPYTFTPNVTNAIYKELISLRGATLHHLEEDKAKAARPWYIKAGEYLKITLKWLDDKGLAKWFVVVILLFLLALILKMLGFDRNGIIEIIKPFIKP
jgi:hypothetical protein